MLRNTIKCPIGIHSVPHAAGSGQLQKCQEAFDRQKAASARVALHGIPPELRKSYLDPRTKKPRNGRTSAAE